MGWDFAAELDRHGPDSLSVGAPRLSASRAYCARVTHTHYENFTVASFLLPRPLIPHFQAIYAYCRWADDLADEVADGDTSLRLLDWWRSELLACYRGTSRHPVMVALQETVRRFDIPSKPFLDLLTAFEQDQRVKRYDTFDQLLGYCRNSANPVGRLILYLFRCHDDVRGRLADDVCTGLQLANFWQDVRRDFAIGRIYLPLEDLIRFRVTDDDLAAGRFTSQFSDMMRFQIVRTRGYFARGSALIDLLPIRMRVDVELFIRGGKAVLEAIADSSFDVLNQRPQITGWGKLRLLMAAWVSTYLGLRRNDSRPDLFSSQASD